MISPLTSTHCDRNSTTQQKKAYDTASLTVLWLWLEMTAHHPHTCHSSVMDIQVVRSRGLQQAWWVQGPHMLIVVALQLAVGGFAHSRVAAQLLLTLGEQPRTCRVATAGIHPPWFYLSSEARSWAHRDSLSADFVIKYSWLSALACRVLIEFCIFRRD